MKFARHWKGFALVAFVVWALLGFKQQLENEAVERKLTDDDLYRRIYNWEEEGSLGQ